MTQSSSSGSSFLSQAGLSLLSWVAVSCGAVVAYCSIAGCEGEGLAAAIGNALVLGSVSWLLFLGLGAFQRSSRSLAWYAVRGALAAGAAVSLVALREGAIIHASKGGLFARYALTTVLAGAIAGAMTNRLMARGKK